MEETCKLRQENELQAIQAIYMDDFQDLLEKVGYKTACAKFRAQNSTRRVTECAVITTQYILTLW